MNALTPQYFKRVDALIYSTCLVGCYDQIQALVENLRASGQAVVEQNKDNDGNFNEVRMTGSIMPIFIIDLNLKHAYVCNTYVTDQQEGIPDDTE